MSDARGAGKVGGLLFLAVVIVVAYLVISAVSAVLKWVLGAAFAIVVVAIVVSLVKRR